MNLEAINQELKGKTPAEIVSWALQIAKNPIVTTNFRPLEATILHLVSSQKSDIPVIWCDSGYNTSYTYANAHKTIEQLNLNIDLFVPKQSVAYRTSVMGIPDVDSPLHPIFTKQVKLEPFSRAMLKHQPDVWFTNLRKGQTDFRSNLDVVSQSSDGIIKVSPFFHWSDEELEVYLNEHQLESEDRYYDPTKALDNRECGLHTA